MTFWGIILLAFGLALDAFSVSAAAGAYFGKSSFRQRFRLSFHFGLFQFIMPVLGWMAGVEIVDFIKDYDHWLAFGVLSVIGTKMILDGKKCASETVTKDISKGWTLISLSVATSIDALAVGFSLGLIIDEIFLPALIIGVVAAGMTLLGIKLGEKLSQQFGKGASIAGGIVLILIGLWILADHTILTV